MAVSVFNHTSVMLEEAVDGLAVAPGGRYCDATLGGAGHARKILEQLGPSGQLIGIDRDPEALAASRQALAPHGDQVTLFHGSFAEAVQILADHGLIPVDGFLLDLGVSSHQMTTPERGFSLAAEGPLDMRMDPTRGPTAAELIAGLSVDELARLLRRYGEEPAGKRLARVIKAAQERGELNSTGDLERVVSAALGGHRPRQGRIHPATRTFMALRIAVNDELGSLDRFLDTFTEALRPGGRVVVISFHSLEDRQVKQAFHRLAHPCTCPSELPVCVCNKRPQLQVMTRRPLRPSADEIAQNPRARSAKLRIAQRC